MNDEKKEINCVRKLPLSKFCFMDLKKIYRSYRCIVPTVFPAPRHIRLQLRLCNLCRSYLGAPYWKVPETSTSNMGENTFLPQRSQRAQRRKEEFVFFLSSSVLSVTSVVKMYFPMNLGYLEVTEEDEVG